MLIIPAIDIMSGRCVRLTQGDFREQTIYSDDPAEMARSFVGAGLSFLHVVDLDGAKKQTIVSWKTIASIASVPGVSIEVGGGIRTSEEIRRLFDLGVARVIVGSIAAKSPHLLEYWIEQFGSEKIVVGMDIKNGSVAVSGWLEDSRRSPEEFLRDLVRRRARTFICTDVSRDGTLEGPNVDLYASLTRMFGSVEIVASGGVGKIGDVAALERTGCRSVIVGKALYEGTISLDELRPYSRISPC